MKKLQTKVFVGIIFLTLMNGAVWATQKCNENRLQSTPAERFKVNVQEGTVFDFKTKLTWKICAEGSKYENGHCDGNEFTNYLWNDAIERFSGKENGWRIPSIDELKSIVENQCTEPAINTEIFPDTPINSIWSSSISIKDSNSAWSLYFRDGKEGLAKKGGDINKRNLQSVRLVRGEQWINPLGVLYQEKKQLEQETSQLQREIQSETDSFVNCKSAPKCQTVFSLTQLYINAKSDQKIQLATDTIIETYNPTSAGNVALKAIKIPGKLGSATIRLTATCETEDYAGYEQLCRKKKFDIYTGFRPYIEQMLSQ
jgi:hypothetical protein